ncbi:hypothetical protein ACFL6I_12350 [candidate division KSB1 bacterium]
MNNEKTIADAIQKILMYILQRIDLKEESLRKSKKEANIYMNQICKFDKVIDDVL